MVIYYKLRNGGFKRQARWGNGSWGQRIQNPLHLWHGHGASEQPAPDVLTPGQPPLSERPLCAAGLSGSVDTIVDGIVKEDIVVADESALKKVAIRLPIGYNYSINEDQSVSIADGDEVPFTFDPPKVYDVEGNEEIAKVELMHLENYIYF